MRAQCSHLLRYFLKQSSFHTLNARNSAQGVLHTKISSFSSIESPGVSCTCHVCIYVHTCMYVCVYTWTLPPSSRTNNKCQIATNFNTNRPPLKLLIGLREDKSYLFSSGDTLTFTLPTFLSFSGGGTHF